MKTSFRSIKGTFDILPEESSADGSVVAGAPAWQFVETTVRSVMERFNFNEIRTPILEPTELIARGIGQLTDIVQKEMFAFERGDTHYVLRPEITAPIMRAYLQHHLDQKGGVQKLYYIGPCFRAERPQKGRFRQFHQFGSETIGTADARADAETIALMMAVYEHFGVTGTRLRINTLGSAATRPAFKEALREHLLPVSDRLSETSRQRLETNPLRILDTKDEREQHLLQGAPILRDFLAEEDVQHYEQVKQYLADLEIAFEEDPRLVRGLDYYTQTAFELESANLGAQSALAGGGRYDLLAHDLGSSQPVPAVGFAAGIERLFLALAAQHVPLPEATPPDAFIVALGEQAERWAFRQAQLLRKMGFRIGLDLKGRSMKAQMREANRQNAKKTIIVGETELASTTAQVREMATSEQATVPFAAIADYLTA